jgi:hypothetical protein
MDENYRWRAAVARGQEEIEGSLSGKCDEMFQMAL